jgi:hypothetical protein
MSRYNRDEFGFEGKNELWSQFMTVIDLNIKAETDEAISLDIKGEDRIYACGRASALRDLKRLFLEERKAALDRKNINWTSDEELNSL